MKGVEEMDERIFIGKNSLDVYEKVKEYNMLRKDFRQVKDRLGRDMKTYCEQNIHCYENVYRGGSAYFQGLCAKAINYSYQAAKRILNNSTNKEKFERLFMADEEKRLGEYLAELNKVEQEFKWYIDEKKREYNNEVDRRRNERYDGSSLPLIGSICYGISGALAGQLVNMAARVGSSVIDGISNINMSRDAEEDIYKEMERLYSRNEDEMKGAYVTAILNVMDDLLEFIAWFCSDNGHVIVSYDYDRDEINQCLEQMKKAIIEEDTNTDVLITKACKILNRYPYISSILNHIAVLDSSLKMDVLNFANMFYMVKNVNEESINLLKNKYKEKKKSISKNELTSRLENLKFMLEMHCPDFGVVLKALYAFNKSGWVDYCNGMNIFLDEDENILGLSSGRYNGHDGKIFLTNRKIFIYRPEFHTFHRNDFNSVQKWDMADFEQKIYRYQGVLLKNIKNVKYKLVNDTFVLLLELDGKASYCKISLSNTEKRGFDKLRYLIANSKENENICQDDGYENEIEQIKECYSAMHITKRWYGTEENKNIDIEDIDEYNEYEDVDDVEDENEEIEESQNLYVNDPVYKEIVKELKCLGLDSRKNECFGLNKILHEKEKIYAAAIGKYEDKERWFLVTNERFLIFKHYVTKKDFVLMVAFSEIENVQYNYTESYEKLTLNLSDKQLELDFVPTGIGCGLYEEIKLSIGSN